MVRIKDEITALIIWISIVFALGGSLLLEEEEEEKERGKGAGEGNEEEKGGGGGGGDGKVEAKTDKVLDQEVWRNHKSTHNV